VTTPVEISVAIVEDDPATREALSALIGGTPGFLSIATFESVEQALTGLERRQPDLLLLDIHLPGLIGSQGVGVLRERYPRVQVVMLTVFAEEERIFESLCNGACGYLLKRTPPARLLEALREAHEGGSPMSPDIARKVVRTFQKAAPPGQAAHALTPHEVRVVRMLATGDSYQEIAERFGITVNTVRNYIRSIYDKLQVHTKSEAVSKALRGRLID
jgi:DNA-binding NarL/FixJ family response regulator